MNRIFIYKKSMQIVVVGFLVVLLGLQGCKKVLDKKDLSAVPEDLVWNNVDLSTQFLNNIYLNTLSGWPSPTDHNSDEAGGGFAMYGQLTINSVNYWPYATIRSVNLLLQEVPGTNYPQADKDRLKGQALFLRAWLYFQLVSRYGGVPILLVPQALEEDLNVKRNKTSECIAQIIKDLDEAAVLLPPSWNADNEGRITKAAALSFKGRVLLHYASEQFTPTQMQSRWETAFQANKAAMDLLTQQGFTLMPSFSNLWFVEGSSNKEAILVTRYNNPGRTQTRDASVRPLEESQNFTGGDQPTLELVRAFPMKNGLPITDPASGYDANTYWLNRDPRFATTVVHNGDAWALSGKTGRIQWTFKGAESQGGSGTSFYSKKAIFEGYKPFDAERSGTDWIEIRLAEVMLNYAETANETGNTQIAYDMLTAIRKRAGIEPGTNNLYGLKASMTPGEMRNAILNERFLELAFEGKREQDLRRRRLYGPLLNGKKRMGYDVTLVSGTPSAFFTAYATGNINLNTSYFTYFKETEKPIDLTNVIAYKDEYYFFAIPQSHLQVNPNLEQTKGWPGGTFDPLQ
ncbi:RagB/SusD family nutrient uptake outer membrane protein [Pedobacter frigoris]|uniref:RagB/SusD family nutrient uptake outer membrane protein n=1 Tax=Pedobacter frigoris TaxID=2571272 RepID=UPI00292DC3C6|nr:RagB/SusD family nutrient uptake outer membrane protein [Pedobacter frigoris]